MVFSGIHKEEDREMKESREKVEKVQDLLFDQIVQSLLYFYCARSLHEAFRQSELMKRSYFFFAVYQAAVSEAILALSRILKEHKDSITIHYLFNLAENEPRLFSSDSPETVRSSVAAHRARLEEYGPLIDSVIEQRDRVGAHLDRRHVNNPSDLFAHPHGVNLTEVGECLREVLDILNLYARYYGKEFRASHLERAVAGDVDILLKWMKQHGRPEEWIRPPVF